MTRAILTLAVAFLLASVASAQVDAPRITQQDFKRLVAAKNVLIVDTRSVDAYEMSHIPGAVLLPLEGLAAWPAEYEKVAQTIQKSTKPVVTYCA